MIVALAGRRIDVPDDEEKRFPLEMEETIYIRIREFFHKHKVNILISSAACGADLLAQKAAWELGIERHIILPFGREKFRKTSVTDRSGDWGKLFDEVCNEVESKGNLTVLEGFDDNEENGYSAVTVEILKHAKNLQTKNKKVLAVAVWEGNAKNETDETASFIRQAKVHRIEVEEIATK